MAHAVCMPGNQDKNTDTLSKFNRDCFSRTTVERMSLNVESFTYVASLVVFVVFFGRRLRCFLFVCLLLLLLLLLLAYCKATETWRLSSLKKKRGTRYSRI
jgi:hypothetical protein